MDFMTCTFTFKVTFTDRTRRPDVDADRAGPYITTDHFVRVDDTDLLSAKRTAHDMVLGHPARDTGMVLAVDLVDVVV